MGALPQLVLLAFVVVETNDPTLKPSIATSAALVLLDQMWRVSALDLMLRASIQGSTQRTALWPVPDVVINH
jgi:hypothetical protein